MSLWLTITSWLSYTYTTLIHSSLETAIWRYMPFVILLELPLTLLVWFCVLLYGLKLWFHPKRRIAQYPKWSVIITCYSEGKDVYKSIVSILEQLYPTDIQIIAVIDGAKANRETYQAAMLLQKQYAKKTHRELIILPKWKRGGRVSSLNSGLQLVKHELVLVLDGDSSCDNDALIQASQSFSDPKVIAVSGGLRVRNAKKNLCTRLQALEYMLSLMVGKTGLNEINAVNNISGAFGMFRRRILHRVIGWDSGSAEDLDMTMRLKNFFGKYRELKIIFNPKVMAHTDAPDTWRGYFKQRLRWEGDLFYIYAKKHWASFKPSQVGWINFFIMIWTGLVFQIAFPMIVIVFLSYLIITQEATIITFIMISIYLFYLLVALLGYLEYMLIISERKRYDLSFCWYLLLLPCYTFISRIWAGVAVLSEIFLRSHQDTSMAPWWVLKKSKF